jgi:hypothetical protein
MTEDSVATAITRLGWRQGSVLGQLLASEAIRLKPDRVRVDESDWLIVTSHDCDIANSSLEKEPLVEVLRASVSRSSPDGSFQCGRNPRNLHLLWETGEDRSCLRCNIHERWAIPRELLAGEAPRPGLIGRPLRIVVEWLAKRYLRPAFPTEFDRRWKAKVREWEALLKRNSEWIQGIYLRLSTLDELVGDQPYRCQLIVSVPAGMRKGRRWAVEKDRLETAVMDFWRQFEPGVLCDGAEVLGTDEVTLADIEPYQRFDADWVSFADDSPSTPAVVDMSS